MRNKYLRACIHAFFAMILEWTPIKTAITQLLIRLWWTNWCCSLSIVPSSQARQNCVLASPYRLSTLTVCALKAALLHHALPPLQDLKWPVHNKSFSIVKQRRKVRKLYVILRQALQEWENHYRLLHPFEGKQLEQTRPNRPAHVSPKGEPLGSLMLGWKYTVHPDTPTMIGWTIIGS